MKPIFSAIAGPVEFTGDDAAEDGRFALLLSIEAVDGGMVVLGRGETKVKQCTTRSVRDRMISLSPSPSGKARSGHQS
jgi:hypothetical protein